MNDFEKTLDLLIKLYERGAVDGLAVTWAWVKGDNVQHMLRCRDKSVTLLGGLKLTEEQLISSIRDAEELTQH